MTEQADDQAMTPRTITTASGQEVDPLIWRNYVDDYPGDTLNLELSEALMKAVEATQIYNKVSTLTIKLKVGPGGGLPGELGVAIDVTDNPARPKAPVVTFFGQKNGGLGRRDPQQARFPTMEDD